MSRMQHKIKLKVDADARELKLVSNSLLKIERDAKIMSSTTSRGFDKVSSSAKRSTLSMSNTSNEIVRMIRRYESLVVGIYAVKKAYDLTLGIGHEYNKLIENETAGMKILAVQNLKNIDVMGEKVTLTDKYTEATKKSLEMLQLVRDINPETPYNLGDTIKTYKSLFPQLVKYKASLEDIAEVTKKMTILGKAMNLDTGQFIKTIDTAFTGAMKPSQMQIALNQVGITNKLVKQWQQSGTLIENILARLSQIDPKLSGISQNFDTIASNFGTQWHELMGELQKPIFDALKKDIASASLFIKDNKKELLELGDTIGTVVKYSLELASAYAGVKIASQFMNIALRTNVGATAAATLAMREYSASGVIMAGTMTKIGRSAKALALGNPILTLATIAMGAYEFATHEAQVQEDRLTDSVGKSREEILKLGAEQQRQSENAIRLKIEELKAQNKLIEKSKIQRGFQRVDKETVYENAGIDFLDRRLKSEKQLDDMVALRLEKNKEEVAELTKQLNIYTKITPELKELHRQREAITEAIKIENTEVAKINYELSTSNNLTDEKMAKLESERTALQNNIVELKNGVTEIDTQRRTMEDVGGAIDFATGQADNLSASLNAGAKNALALKNALLQSMVVSGELTKQQYADKKYVNDAQNINNTLSGDARIAKLIDLDNKYKEQKKRSIDEIARKQKQASSALLQDQISLYQAQGKSDKVLSAKINRIKNSEIPENRKLLQIEALKLNAQKASAKSSAKASKSGARAATRALSNAKKLRREQEKLSKEQRSAYKEYLKVMGGKDNSIELSAINATEKFDELVSVLELTEKQQDSLFNKIAEDAKNAGDHIDNLGDKLKNALGIDSDSMFGNLFDNLMNSISGISEAASSSDPFAKSEAAKSLVVSSLDMIPGLGKTVEFIGGLFSSTLSQEELDAAAGRSDFTNESLNNIRNVLEDNNLVSGKMLTHLNSMDNKFGAIANALGSAGGVSFDGSDYQDSASGNWWGGKSKTLIGAGLEFGEQTVNAFMSGVDVAGYQAIHVKKSSFFGLIKKEKIKEIEIDVPDSLRLDIQGVLNDGIQTVMESIDILGLDTESIKAEIQNYVIDLGKIDFKDLNSQEKQEALNAAFGEQLDNMFSGALDNIAGDQTLQALESVRKTGEGTTEELVRLAVGFETVDSQLMMFGQSVDNFAQSQALIDASGGLDKWRSGMEAFQSGFYSTEEQKAYTQSVLAHALAINNVALPASKAEFRALVETTQAKIIALKADIQIMETELAAKVQSGEISLAVAQGELDTKVDIANKTGEVINSHIKANNAFIRSTHEGSKSVVAFGNSVNAALMGMLTGAAQAAIDGQELATTGIGGIDYSTLHSTELDAARSQLGELEGLYGTLMSNMSEFSSFYNDSAGGMESATKSAGSAAKSATEKFDDLTKSLISIANLKAVWNSDDISGKKIILDATRRITGLTNLTYDNFLSEFTKLTSSGLGIDQKTLTAWTDMSGALRALKDAEDKRLGVELDKTKKDISFYEGILSSIEQLRDLGRTDAERLAFEKSKLLDASSNDDIIKNTLDLAKSLKDSTTSRVEYKYELSKLEKTLAKLEPEKEDATRKDIVDELKDVKKELRELKNEQIKIRRGA